MKKRYLGSLYFLQYKETAQKSVGSLLFSIIALLLLLNLSSSSTYAQNGFTITEDFKGNSIQGITLGGTAYLTSGVNNPPLKVDDPADEGWLRLTNAENQKRGYALIDESFPTGLGFLLDLEFVTWGGNGADGFSFFLYDSKYVPNPDPALGELQFEIGAQGGALGYAQRFAIPGVTGGYIGVGLDEYGDFGSTSDGKLGGFPGAGASRSINSLAIRGPYNVGPNNDRFNYEFLGGTADLPTMLGIQNFTLDYKPSVPFRPSEDLYYRRIILSIKPIPSGSGVKYEVSTKIKTDVNGNFQTVLQPFLIDEVPPANLNLGFAATTGGQTHVHEVRNVMITTPTGVWVHKKVNKNRAYVGDELVYDIDLFNQNDEDLTNLKFSDVLPSDFQPTSIVFNDNGNPLNTVSYAIPGDLSDVTIGLGALDGASFKVTGIITGAPASGILVNTAHFHANGMTDDPDQTNDYSTAETIIMDPKLSFEKTGIYVDTNGDNRVNVGDRIEYSFKVTNTGNMDFTDITIDDPLITVNGGPIDLDVGEFDDTTFTGYYEITQVDIDNGGVYNLATVEGEYLPNRTLEETSVDPDPLDPTDPNYDPARPDHTFVPLDGADGSLMITNPNIYQKVKGN